MTRLGRIEDVCGYSGLSPFYHIQQCILQVHTVGYLSYFYLCATVNDYEGILIFLISSLAGYGNSNRSAKHIQSRGG